MNVKSLAAAVLIMAASASWANAADKPDLQAAKAPADAIWADSLDLGAISQGWGSPRAGKSVDKNPLTLGGQVYKHGIGTHAVSEMEIELAGGARRFVSMVGIDDEVANKGSATFEVWVDGEKKATAGPLHGGEPVKLLDVDLTGAKRLLLVVDDAGDGFDHDHADWAGAMFILDPGAKTKPQTIVPGANEPQIQIAHESSAETRINGPRVIGGTPGRPFVFRIPATGKAPLIFAAKGLPAGLILDTQTGVIAGKALGESGALISKYDIALTVTSQTGVAHRKLTLVTGEHQLAQTPPLGWNSWNVWAGAVDDAKIRAAADAMIASGLAAHGFQYVNIDDCWEAGRDANGEIQTNERFPDMKALGDYIHSKGLRFGIYSSPGPKTCAGYTASYQHEDQDAATWAKWGVDYIKYDWCSYGGIAGKDKDLEAMQKPYRVMRASLDKCDRDIIYSLCQYGMGNVWTWGAEVGGNVWRTTGDIRDTWGSMSGIGFEQGKCSPYAGPGHWNDPDMLVVGKVGWGPKLHDTHLTRNEQVTHITLWSLLSSPMLIGCDMTAMDPFTVDVLCNDEVLAVNQDPLGKAAGLKARVKETEVWARPLADGTIAVGLFNRGRSATTVTAKWSDLDLKGVQPVRDLWQHKNLGTHTNTFSVELPRHAAALVKIGTPRAGE
jgi:alpha-galactosidase